MSASKEKTLKPLLGFILMAVGMFMALLDTQILGSSLHEVQAGLSATPEEISLVQTSYLIAEVIMIPLAAWFSSILSTRVLFSISCAGFTIASIGCGGAWDIQSMMVFRAAQGFLGGAMIPTAFASGFMMFPGERNQAKIAAVLGLMATLAPVLGPSIGGLITDALTWRWLFFINIVPGIVVCIAVAFIVDIDRPDFSVLRRFDILGAVSLALFLGLLQYVLDEGPRRAWLEDVHLLSFLLVSMMAGVIFVWRSLSYSHPIVHLRAFSNLSFTLGCVLSFVVGIGLYGSIYMTPLFLGLIRHFSALQIGATVFVTGLFQVGATFLSIALRKYLSNQTILALGFLIFYVSCVLFQGVTASWGYWELLVPQALRGMGTMLCVIPLTSLALGSFTGEVLKGASGIYNLMRNLGGAIGLALINTELFFNRFDLHYRQLADYSVRASARLSQASEQLLFQLNGHIVDSDRAQLLATKLLDSALRQQALVLSFSDVYRLMATAFLLGLVLILYLRLKSRHVEPSTAPIMEH
ncbi:DHA2 family efflux MFS transporter permease subunit [Undibacterium cyanobacteriorum]|uniref:DHA2 family efflux MFS transporter permease subunit n=1 Tax=Undibacterium cyanobacteriorum TaxID=3073561 RepID=A0ABY9RLJ7_9BURK|nr:DHA2 family efflux MFS transporter permease subunit [Undibacterium sp. 20NA77.5]WMW81555.1 DHA2 family efflux MFS transporter permease subunit [Undibacterium sp. 20NA77.5]